MSLALIKYDVMESLGVSTVRDAKRALCKLGMNVDLRSYDAWVKVHERVAPKYRMSEFSNRTLQYNPAYWEMLELEDLIHHLLGDEAPLLLQYLRSISVDFVAMLRQIDKNCLVNLCGISEAGANRMLAAVALRHKLNEWDYVPTCIDSPADAAVLFQEITEKEVEHLMCLYLNVKNHLLGKVILTKGSTTETLAPPKQIFLEALRHNASRVVVAHNHPSGSVEPSEDDLSLTKQLIEAGKLLNIPLCDHLIVARGARFVSLRETYMFNWCPVD